MNRFDEIIEKANKIEKINKNIYIIEKNEIKRIAVQATIGMLDDLIENKMDIEEVKNKWFGD